MGIRIGDITSRFELMNWNEPLAGRTKRGFVGHDEALRFLQSHLMSDDVIAEARRWSFGLGIHHRTNRGVLQLLANAITTGEVWVSELERLAPAKGGGVQPGPGPEPGPSPGPGPKPGPAPKPVAELLVTVKNLFGKGVEGVTVTAGALGTKTTDKDGIADFGTVTPGTYDVTAAKAGHGKVRNGPELMDEKKAVSVPDGSKTKVDLIQHPECANVAFFEGSKTRANYFGFDHKTNIKAAVNGEYWVPVPDKGTLTMPTNRFTRDEARWVSVAVGKQTELEINYAFKGTECIPCLANSTFQIIPATVAEVVTAKITAKQAVFKIKGLAVGEASLKVICDGHDIGWFHIWCEVEKELLIDVATIVTNRAAAATYDLAGLSTYMNEIYQQHLVKLNLKDLGVIDLKSNVALATAETAEYPAAGGLFQQDGIHELFMSTLDLAAKTNVANRTTGASARAGARRLYFYVPTAGAQWGGMVVNIGHPATFIFYADGTPARNTGAHEIGHSMKLRHPSDPSGAAQFAAHNLATINTATLAFAATNTEPASAANPAHSNILANDPTNLMGYWPDKTARKYLRYHQWKAADRS
jgi:hypothetical protein